MLSLSSINHRSHAVAHQIHAVQMAAYKQEAELLRVDRFPPLARTVDDVLTSLEEFIGAFDGGTLAGVLSACPDEEGRGISISSLVVHPAYQKRGLGLALVREATQRYLGSELTVQTAAANIPALTLYERLGFKVYRRWAISNEPFEMVKLSRSPAQPPCAV